MGPEQKAGARIKELSGSRRRRLDVALGVIGSPELLLLDEPTTGCALLGIAISSVPRSGRSATSVVVLPFLVPQFVSGVCISVDTLPGWMLNLGALFPPK